MCNTKEKVGFLLTPDKYQHLPVYLFVAYNLIHL